MSIFSALKTLLWFFSLLTYMMCRHDFRFVAINVILLKFFPFVNTRFVTTSRRRTSALASNAVTNILNESVRLARRYITWSSSSIISSIKHNSLKMSFIVLICLCTGFTSVNLRENSLFLNVDFFFFFFLHESFSESGPLTFSIQSWSQQDLRLYIVVTNTQHFPVQFPKLLY